MTPRNFRECFVALLQQQAAPEAFDNMIATMENDNDGTMHGGYGKPVEGFCEQANIICISSINGDLAIYKEPIDGQIYLSYFQSTGHRLDMVKDNIDTDLPLDSKTLVGIILLQQTLPDLGPVSDD